MVSSSEAYISRAWLAPGRGWPGLVSGSYVTLARVGVGMTERTL